MSCLPRAACLLLGVWVVAAVTQERQIVEDEYFDVNDILDGKLIPIQLLSKQMEDLIVYNRNVNENTFFPTSTKQLFEMTAMRRPNLTKAFAAMGFHRRMLNEFMAADYLAQQILNNKEYLIKSNSFALKRMGPAVNSTEYAKSKLKSRSLNQNTLHELLDDEGMDKYKSWLDRTTTLEDVQRQLGGSNLNSKPTKQFKLEQYQQQEGNNLDDDDQNFEDGDITGYALANNPYDYNQHYVNKNWILPASIENIRAKLPFKLHPVSKTGYDSSYDDYGLHAPPSHPIHPQTPPPPARPSIQGKEISLKDITDIALTTLAFLSFGMFILQVLMCITMGKDDTNNMMMLPMEGIDGGDIPGDGDGIEEIRRKKRSIFAQSNNLNMVNDFARKVLFSTDVVLSNNSANMSCYYWVLCNNNRIAKSENNDQKFWVPAWSLGMSWLTMRLHQNTTAALGYASIIQSLRAMVLGLIGNQRCESYFENTCDRFEKPFKSSI